MKQSLDERMTEERDLECSYQGEENWVEVVAIWVGLVLPFAWAIFVVVAWALS